jgi:tetratricopeptide (TPR) repeat protein
LAYANRDFGVCSLTDAKEQNDRVGWGNHAVAIPNANTKTKKSAASTAMNGKNMKQLIYAVLGIIVIGGGIALYASRQKNPAVPPAQIASQASTSAAANVEPPVNAAARQLPPRTVELSGGNSSADPADARPVVAEAAPEATSPVDKEVKQLVDTLVSRQAGFDQKQAAWKKLKDSGKFDQAIAELEQRAAANPQAAEYPATLGQAYLQKSSTLQDLREQGILAMKADQTFDAALQIDPKNWEARFIKAVAMSYWPPQLNKGQEVIDHFTQLIEQQETQPPQPQFAATYLWLGDHYQKTGKNDYARATWQCGAERFPADAALKQRLAQPAGQ